MLLDLQRETMAVLGEWASDRATPPASLDHLVSRLATLPDGGEGYRDWLKTHGLLPAVSHLVVRSSRRTDRDGSGNEEGPDSPWQLQRRASIRRSLQWESTARAVAGLLDGLGRPWALLKGFALAHRVYDDPSMRLGVDLDLLVADKDSTRVADLFLESGAQEFPNQRHRHERTFRVEHGFVDVHNAPLRRGRLREDPTDRWLARRQRVADFPFLAPHDELVLSLVHTAVTEYLTARHVRMLDILLQVRRASQPVDWSLVADDTRRLGLANAAYLTGLRVNALFGVTSAPPIPEAFLASLGVGAVRRRYWHYWASRRPDRLFQRSPHLARSAFSLWLGDSGSDWIRALRDRGQGD